MDVTAHSAATEDFAAALRDRGLRVTSSRLAVLSYLATHQHCSAGEIQQGLRGEHPSLSPQSVHNIVCDLTECGLLRRVEIAASGSALYEFDRHDNHHHVRCVVCGRLEDVPCLSGRPPCLHPEHPTGMRILEAQVTFTGICANCEESALLHPSVKGTTSVQ